MPRHDPHALPTVAMEVIFVDDSTDGTAELVEELAAESEHELVLLPQTKQRRISISFNYSWF